MSQRKIKAAASDDTIASLQVESLAATDALARSDLLGIIAPRQAFSGRAIPADLPLLRINTRLLASSDEACCEVLLSRQRIRCGLSAPVADAGPIPYRCSDDFIFGAIEIDESRFVLDGEATPLLQAAEAGYRAIFRLLEELGYSTLLRAWNYIGRINVDSHGIERYRQFNIGRQNAFVSDGRAITGNVPAACALGVDDGPLQLAFLGSRQAMRAIENPRQVSAYHYPSQYGPRSPTFSRAALLNTAQDEILFISGTASIIGHQSVHPGDIVAQVTESLANVSILLDQANKVRHAHLPCTLADVCYRVYVRHAADLPVIRRTFEAIVGPEAVAVYLLSDVCRTDLLVEIEGAAMLARGFEA